MLRIIDGIVEVVKARKHEKHGWLWLCVCRRFARNPSILCTLALQVNGLSVAIRNRKFSYAADAAETTLSPATVDL